METFLDRLLDEKDQLSQKMEKLSDFFANPKFLEINKVQQQLLNIQYAAMGTYLKCLIERIHNITT